MPFTVEDLGLTIDRSAIAEEQERWKSRLYLVASAPYRLLGLICDARPWCGAVSMYAATVYLCNIAVQPQGPGGYRLVPMPQAVVPFDFIGDKPLNYIILNHYENAIRIADQGKEVRDFFYEQYLTVVDGPPRVIQPTIEVPR